MDHDHDHDPGRPGRLPPAEEAGLRQLAAALTDRQLASSILIGSPPHVAIFRQALLDRRAAAPAAEEP